MLAEIRRWEGEGGSLAREFAELTGSEAQIEWAERLRRGVEAEFARVAAALRLAAVKQSPLRRAATDQMLRILEAKRVEVLSHERAGYYIKEWQEPGGHPRRLLLEDPRYEALRQAVALRGAEAESESEGSGSHASHR